MNTVTTVISGLAVAALLATAAPALAQGVSASSDVEVGAQATVDYGNAQPMPLPSIDDDGPAYNQPNPTPSPSEKCNDVSVPCDTQTSVRANSQADVSEVSIPGSDMNMRVESSSDVSASYGIFTPIVKPVVSFFARISAFFGF